MELILKNGNIVKEGNELKLVDIKITDGIITEISSNLEGDNAIDLKGQLITPGLIDVHVHFREPGFTDKETIESGSQAAARGGFTTVCAMPNTNPVCDTPEKFEQIKDIIKEDAVINVLQYAPITYELRSDKLVDMNNIDAFAYTNDGVGVQTANVMYEAMKLATSLNKPIVAHTEDDSLLYGGVMHEGIKNKELNLPGIMGIVESSQVARDILIAKEVGAHYHICHVSSKETVQAVRDGKAQGVNVTCEVAPHHLILNEMDILSDDAVWKMNPPLRSKEDQKALIEGFIDGTIEIIATDHAPHSDEEKSNGFLNSPFGIVGIETSFALMYTHFVKTNLVSLEFLINAMCKKPAQLFDLEENEIKVGQPANIAVFNIEDEVIIDPSEYLSKSSVTPFNNTKVFGMCSLTLYNGNIVYESK